MQIPHLAIYVNDKDELILSHVLRPEGEPLDVERPLKELSDQGLDEATKGIGRVVLGTMAGWYPQEMGMYPELAVPYNEEGDMTVILSLISKSVVGKTKVHFASIDALIEEVIRKKPALAANSAIATWPQARSMIEKKAPN